MAANATFALKPGLCVRRTRLVMVAPDTRHSRRSQAETPLIGLSEFGQPPLVSPAATSVLRAAASRRGAVASVGRRTPEPLFRRASLPEWQRRPRQLVGFGGGEARRDVRNSLHEGGSTRVKTADLIDHVASEADVEKNAAKKAVDAVFCRAVHLLHYPGTSSSAFLLRARIRLGLSSAPRANSHSTNPLGPAAPGRARDGEPWPGARSSAVPGGRLIAVAAVHSRRMSGSS